MHNGHMRLTEAASPEINMVADLTMHKWQLL